MNASVEVRRLALSVGLAVLAGAMPALSADLEDPLSPLVSAKGSVLCFRRDYSPEHLAQHPKQTTKAVLLAFQQGYFGFQQANVAVVLTPRTGAAKRIAAGCYWWEGAGIDTSGRKMFPGFDKPVAFACMAIVTDSSAQEGGSFVIDPAPDAKSLTLFLENWVAAFDDKRSKIKADFMTLGPEDLTFALTRTDPEACASFRAVTE